MPVDSWLCELPARDTNTVEADIMFLSHEEYPLLCNEQVKNHVTQLSGYLTDMSDDVRRHLIDYSLYARQLDIVQASLSKEFCASECARAPVGCCNNSHHQIFSFSDIMMNRPTGLAMQLADAIGRMQVLEGDFHALEAEAVAGARCRYFRQDGCTLRLFKSPLCLHYQCESLQERIGESYGQDGAHFASCMKSAAATQIVSSKDFTSSGVVQAVMSIFDPC